MSIESAHRASTPPPTGISASDEAGGLVFRAEGDWVVATATELDRSLHALRLPHDRRVTLDLSGIGHLDTAGAWLLLRTEHDLASHGNNVTLANVPAAFEPLIQQVRGRDHSAPLPPDPGPRRYSFVGFLARTGQVSIAL
jgi:phospholipid/cholesterol/gamma-HCH transport system permease protein